jgi:hypothetical protein
VGKKKKKNNNNNNNKHDKRRRGGTYREWWCKLHVLVPMHQESLSPYLLPPSLSLPPSLPPSCSIDSVCFQSWGETALAKILGTHFENPSPEMSLKTRRWIWASKSSRESSKTGTQNSSQSAFAPKSPDRPFLRP